MGGPRGITRPGEGRTAPDHGRGAMTGAGRPVRRRGRPRPTTRGRRPAEGPTGRGTSCRPTRRPGLLRTRGGVVDGIAGIRGPRHAADAPRCRVARPRQQRSPRRCTARPLFVPRPASLPPCGMRGAGRSCSRAVPDPALLGFACVGPGMTTAGGGRTAVNAVAPRAGRGRGSPSGRRPAPGGSPWPATPRQRRAGRGRPLVPEDPSMSHGLVGTPHGGGRRRARRAT